MTPAKRFRFRLPRTPHTRLSEEVDAELRMHLDLRAAELCSSGMSPAEARRQAAKEFGDLEQTRRYCADMDRGEERRHRLRDRAGELAGEVAFAFRLIRRSPAYAAVSIGTLALAIGANTAVFSVANGLLLTPPPYANAGELVALYENNTPRKQARGDMSAADIVDYRAAQRTLTGLAAFAFGSYVMRQGEGDPTPINAIRVSANMFDVLGVKPTLGRVFTRGDDQPGAAPVAVLSHSLWQRTFGSDSTVIGRRLMLNGTPFTVIGVMPKGFMTGGNEQLWTPLDMSPILADANRARKLHWMYAIGRRRPGETVESVRADLMGIARRLESEHPDANAGHYITVEPLGEAMVGADLRRTSLVLVAAAGFVLLIACANVANMALSRALNRRREMAVRAAIGAGRGHLVRQLLVESVVLAIVGGLAGIALALLGTKAVLGLNPGVLPPYVHVGLDARVLAFTLAVSIIAGIVFGVSPALYGSRADLQGTMKAGGRSASQPRGEALRNGLVVIQVALSVVLLVAAGLLGRSMYLVQHVESGFRPERLLTANVNLRGAKYNTKAAINDFYDDVFARIKAAGGVEAVGATSALPLVGSSGCGLAREVDPFPAGAHPEVRCLSARGDYFRAIGTPLLRGRMFDQTDRADGPQVLVINEMMAKAFWPNADPVGRRVRLGPDPAQPWETIIGVVGDIRQSALDGPPQPTAFEYDPQHGWGGLAIVVRTSGDPMAAAGPLQAAVRAVDPSLAISGLQTMEQVVSRSLAPRRFTLAIFGAFALLALVVAALGVYGVVSYGVSSRIREFGIRTALGARAGRLVREVIVSGLAWCALGLALGGVAALGTTRLVRTMLFGVAPGDVLTFGTVGAMLATVTALACLLPAKRAASVDPVIALREE